jgi:hypothetical protein
VEWLEIRLRPQGDWIMFVCYLIAVTLVTVALLGLADIFAPALVAWVADTLTFDLED